MPRERTRADAPETFWALYGGPLLTIPVIGIAEFVIHFTVLSGAPAAGLLLIGLVTIAYGALHGGARAGLISTGMLALFTLHYLSPHASGIAVQPSVFVGGGVIGGLGLAMTWVMSRVKRREDRLRAALRARVEEAEARNRQLVEANAALEAFGYVVSHDLKEPVRALENYLDAARSEWPSDESREYVEEAYESNRRLAQMLRGLLEYSRTSSLPTKPRAVNLKDVLESDACRSQYAPRLEERGAVLRVDDDLGCAVADEVVLAQLFGNTLLNAVRHNPRDDPEVRIRREAAPDGMAHVVIEDNGPGFPDDVLRRFDGLGQPRAATIKGGFGLVIAHRAAARLGGRIWLENGLDGTGAAVHLELPAAPSDAVEAAPHAPRAARPPAVERSQRVGP